MFPWETYHEPEFQIQQNENHGLRINSFVTLSVERDVESVLKGTHGIWDNRSLRFPSSRAFFFFFFERRRRGEQYLSVI